MGEPQVDDLMDVLRADIKDVRPAAGGATADPLVSFNSHESADAPTVIYVDASAEEALPPSSTPSEDPTTGQMGAVRAVESAAQEHKAAAQAVASAARAQEAAARAQESAARAKESTARAKESTARAKESAARAKEAAMRAKEQAAKEKIEVFGGSLDKHTERRHYLNSPFKARYVRLHPQRRRRSIALCAALIGCPHKGDCGEGFFRVPPDTSCGECVWLVF
ncbi:translation initiation factor IF-2-like [Eriocheir sinensis]|uniref:translation initiation factor IF-2-like n=1 Tax=Eriocheir sinensis TaxID=95602 RepID=UPI0021C9032F|nr:translation initiation factor IF-2-like [Eriocheir sinensis]